MHEKNVATLRYRVDDTQRNQMIYESHKNFGTLREAISFID